MKTFLRKLIAGTAVTIFISMLNSCSPVFVASSKPRPVIYTSHQNTEPVYASSYPAVPVQPVVMVPAWAPPYTYVNEVQYYYFPDYMIYYDVFAANYWYFDGFSWVHVITIPSIPVFTGFNPYNSYVVIMNRNVRSPWCHHEIYENQYPRNYYNSAFTPRHSLGSNTILRAYDENQGRPLFIDRHTNREVTVKYDTRPISNSPGRTSETIPNRANTTSVTATNHNAIRNNPSSETTLGNNNPVRTNPDFHHRAVSSQSSTWNQNNVNNNNTSGHPVTFRDPIKTRTQMNDAAGIGRNKGTPIGSQNSYNRVPVNRDNKNSSVPPVQQPRKVR